MSNLEEFSINHWKEIYYELKLLIKSIKSNVQQKPSQMIIDNNEFIRIFKITARTAQRWRDSNLVGFSRINGNIYYTMQDVLNLYEYYYEEPRRKFNQIINKRKKENE